MQPRRRQVVSGGTGRDGSSESGSGDAVVASGCRVGADCGARVGAMVSLVVSTGFLLGGAGSGSVGGLGSGTGVSSTVECFPVVHGGIERNSSKVRTRGLQHFHPEDTSQQWICEKWRRRNGRPDTFLPLMEDGRPRVIDTLFVRVCKCLAAAFVNTFLRHITGVMDEVAMTLGIVR